MNFKETCKGKEGDPDALLQYLPLTCWWDGQPVRDVRVNKKGWQVSLGQGLPAILWLPDQQLLCWHPPLHILCVLPERSDAVLF